jgi:predicted nucleic-acid-binding Zn-ribbon protein
MNPTPHCWFCNNILLSPEEVDNKFKGYDQLPFKLNTFIIINCTKCKISYFWTRSTLGFEVERFMLHISDNLFIEFLFKNFEAKLFELKTNPFKCSIIMILNPIWLLSSPIQYIHKRFNKLLPFL